MKDIPGYEGLYSITKDGKVWSIKNNRFLNPTKNRDGYLKIGLYKENKEKKYSVHRLVAMTYIPNPNNLPQINHINEIKSDNRVENLEWVTHKQNCNHGTRNQKIRKAISGKNNCNYRKPMSEEQKIKISMSKKGKYIGGNNPNSKRIKCIELDKIFESIAEAQEFMNKNRKNTNISSCCRGKQKTAYGLHWEYVKGDD